MGSNNAADEWVDVPLENREPAEDAGWVDVPVHKSTAVSSYEGVNPDDLNFVQKAEMWLQKKGAIKPGMEMFSPASMKGKQQVVEQAADTASLGHYAEGMGAAKSLLGKDYVTERDAVQQRLDETPVENKIGGTVMGIVPHLAVNPTAAPTALGRIGQATAMGAAYGALQDPGSKAGVVDPIQATDRAWGAGKGALFNGGLSGVLEGGIAAIQKGPDFAKNVISKMSNWLTGIKDPNAARRVLDRPAEVLHAYKNPNDQMDDVMELVRSKMDDLKEQVLGKEKTLEAAQTELLQFEDDLHRAIQEEQLASRADLGQAKDEFSQASTAMKEDLAGVKPSVETEQGVTKGLEDLKGTVNQLSEESSQIAAESIIPKSELLNIVKGAKARQFVNGVPVGEGAKSAVAKLEALEADIAQLPDAIGGDDVKKIIQNLDPSINWAQSAGSYMDKPSQAYSDVRQGIDQYLKVTNNAYAEKMDQVAYYTRLLSQGSKEFGNPKMLPGRLNALANDSAAAKKSTDLLSAVEENTGGNYMSDVDAFINSRQTGGSRSAMEAQASQLPEAAALGKAAEKDAYFSDPIAKQVMQEDAVSSSGLPDKVSAATDDLAQATAEYDPFRRLDGPGLQSKVSTASTGANRDNMNLVKEFGEEMNLPELADKVGDMGAAKAYSGAVGPSGSNFGRRTAIAGAGLVLGGGGAYANRHDPVKAGVIGGIGAAAAGAISPAMNIKTLALFGKLLNSGAMEKAGSLVPAAAGASGALRNGATNQLLQDYFSNKQEPAPERAHQDTGRVLRKVQSTPYEQPLQRAAERGDDAYAATFKVMYDNHEEFRSLIDDEDELD